jgi:hypothetical protein
MPRIELLLGQVVLALIVTRGAAQSTPEPVRALEAKICQTPAQSIDLTAAAREAATGRVPVPVPDSVVPAATRFKAGEARFIALYPTDEQTLSDFVRTQHQLPAPSARLFRGAFRMLTAGDQAVTLKAVAFVREPLLFNARADRFEGHVSVGVVTVLDGPAPKLAAPIPFQLLGAVSSKPAMVDHVGPPYLEIAVATPALTCPMDVQVVSAVTPEAVTVSLSAVPTVRLLARPTWIQGFGLESATLSFELVGPRQGVGGDVQLSSTLGRLSGTSFQLLSGHASAQLRSQHAGTAVVTVAGPGLTPVKLEIEFAFPWALLLAALTGGLAGSFMFRRLKLTRVEALASTLLGVLVGVLYVWGMERVPLELPAPVGEILIAVLAALATYHSTKLYARFTRPRIGYPLS